MFVQAFVAVLQSALAREATMFLQKENARAGITGGGGVAATDFADDMGSKVLMEQILLKMKNLREVSCRTNKQKKKKCVSKCSWSKFCSR